MTSNNGPQIWWGIARPRINQDKDIRVLAHRHCVLHLHLKYKGSPGCLSSIEDRQTSDGEVAAAELFMLWLLGWTVLSAKTVWPRIPPCSYYRSKDISVREVTRKTQDCLCPWRLISSYAPYFGKSTLSRAVIDKDLSEFADHTSRVSTAAMNLEKCRIVNV
ncbi:hypothetical protein M438DRAFT_182418 [Aureobasidium pullulans EXF-150]|uniref:Uncharacterized protein n=1 Tax=Aureobasidium pullulans EXF-150 TaxID=1043002 RepID=A0A074X3V1_AURPU|nr:uncharacterized protein M438DRAFT_182418 [Aureobasidium pullulans EXF-150]KEQ78454.1 hypothetical protein M438DRAFT_182418 [Aureobasidium pullulans EXF-150]